MLSSFAPSLPPPLPPFLLHSKVLQLCDHLRDELLPPLGVRLEDKDGVRREGGREGGREGLPRKGRS